jgi:hypothetical protein
VDEVPWDSARLLRSRGECKDVMSNEDNGMRSAQYEMRMPKDE